MMLARLGRSSFGLPARVVGPILGLLAITASPARAQELVPIPTRTVELTTTVTLPPREAAARVWIPIPLATPVQRVIDVSVQAPGTWTIERDTIHGNRYLYVETPAGPYKTTIRTNVVVERQETLGPARETATPEELSAYTQPLRLVPLEHPEIKKRASQALANAGPDPGERGRRLFEYVLGAMDYDKSTEGWGRGDLLYACNVGKGNCTDFHAMFNGLARTANIPARFTMGISLPAEPRGEITGYHCWTAFYAPGLGWVPVDISEADKHPDRPIRDYFAHLDQHRVALTRGRDVMLAPAQIGPPLNYVFDPYVEINGAPSDLAAITRTYRDLTKADLIFRTAAR